MGQMTLLGVSGNSAAPPTYLLHDTFTDADGTDLAAHAMDVGPGWINLGGAAQIQSDAAQQTSDTYTDARYVSDAGQADAELSMTINCATDVSSFIGFILRAQDVNNLWAVGVSPDRGTMYIYEVAAGVYTVAAQTPWTGTPGTPYTLTASVAGNTITVSQGGTSLSYVSSFLQTQTLFGLFSNIQGSTFDDFQVSV